MQSQWIGSGKWAAMGVLAATMTLLGACGGNVDDAANTKKSTPTPGTGGSVSKLPATGVTANQCFKAGSNDLVACNSPEAIALSGAGKQDGMLAAVNPMSYSLVPKAGGGFYDKSECVKDNVTGLIWEGKTADGGLRDKGKTYTHYDDPAQPQKGSGSNPTQAEIDAATNTVGYVKAVNATGLCGASNWRLPTIDELQSIVDYGKPFPGPTLNTDWFVNAMNKGYWSSSPSVGDAGGAWGVYFGYGYVNDGGYRSDYGAVRLVRASQ